MRVLLIEDDQLIAHGMEADVAMDCAEEGVAPGSSKRFCNC